MWQHLNDADLFIIAKRRLRRGDPIPTDLAAEFDRRGFFIPQQN